jgi:hypothetical protein
MPERAAAAASGRDAGTGCVMAKAITYVVILDIWMQLGCPTGWSKNGKNLVAMTFGTGPGSATRRPARAQAPQSACRLAGESAYDQPRPIVRPQDDPVTPRSRPGPGRAGRPDLAEDSRQHDLHLVERKRHPQADRVAAAEGEPLVRAELPLQEPLGAELVWFGIQFRASVDEIGSRA